MVETGKSDKGKIITRRSRSSNVLLLSAEFQTEPLISLGYLLFYHPRSDTRPMPVRLVLYESDAVSFEITLGD